MLNTIIRTILLWTCLSFSGYSLAAQKILYPDGIGGAVLLSRAIPAANTGLNLNPGDSVIIDQTLPFQADFTINPVDIPVPIVVQKIGGGALRTIRVDLYINGTAGTFIGTDSFPLSPAGGTQIADMVILNTTTYDLTAGDYLTLVISNTGAGTYRLRQDASGSSRIVLDTDTVIALEDIGVFRNPWPDTTEYYSYVAGDTVYLRATVSDPFGTADISSVDFTVTDPTASQVFAANITTQSAPAPADTSTAVIETGYTIPAAPAPDGVWTVDFVANEGQEGTVTATDSLTFGVGTPQLSVKKTTATDYDPVNLNDAPKAISSSRVVYTIEVTNTGFGFVDDSSIMISDLLPTAQSTFYFGNPLDPVRFNDGAIASGVDVSFTTVDDPNDDVQFSNDGCASFLNTPTFDAGTGLDTSSPKIDCIWINPKGSMNGSDGSNHPSFSVSFTIQLD